MNIRQETIEERKDRLNTYKDYYKKHSHIIKTRTKKWYQNNPDKVKQHRVNRYGLTIKEVQQKALHQNYRCEICSKSFQNCRMVIDHNHKTRKNRGLLCSNCNTGLGMFEDNILVIKSAITYLEKYD